LSDILGWFWTRYRRLCDQRMPQILDERRDQMQLRQDWNTLPRTRQTARLIRSAG
jgi:hypothetical protein